MNQAKIVTRQAHSNVFEEVEFSRASELVIFNHMASTNHLLDKFMYENVQICSFLGFVIA
jgi:hypothetical protein